MPPAFRTNALPGPNAGRDKWQAFMVKLANHRTPLNRDLVRIAVERREAAAAAADGDRAALERLAVLNREQIEIAARHDVLSTALAVARERWATARLMAAGLAQ
jgi:hypothetical protein